MSEKVLDWFASYLSNRSQKVTVDGVLSDPFGIDFGVPQGSCLGPVLFVIYSNKLFNIVNKQSPNVHAYSDDTQLYLTFKTGDHADETAAVSSIQSCISDVQTYTTIYLVDLIAVAAQSRYNLRSRNATLFVLANARCQPTLGDRAFQSAAPKL